MPHDLVSVVIPTYNRAQPLAAAVDSALGQTHSNVEVVIADDGSTDQTPDLVESRWRGESRVRYHRQENAGVSSARNLAIRHAHGDYVAFLDSDDSWLPWKLELQLACLRAFPQAGMCWTDMDAYGPDGQLLAGRYLRRMYSAWARFTAAGIFSQSRPLAEIVPGPAEADGAWAYAGDIYGPMLTGSLVHTSTTVLTRERLLRVGGFDESLEISGEDYDFHLRTCREGAVVFADLPTIQYQRGRPDQLTRPEYAAQRAKNFLVTVERALASDGNRCPLPPSVVQDVLAEAHEWVASTALDAGDHVQARAHYLEALRRRPGRLGMLPRLAVAALPPGAASSVRQVYRRLKGHA
jgi:glycosyltransferase involved in cell wall biosynthesis